MSADDEPIINLKLSTYDKLREELRANQSTIQELERKLQAAQLADPSGTIQRLFAGFNSAVKIVQFAVGNLDPTTVAGWPHKALTEVADAIEKIPGIDRHTAEVPIELRDFARTAASYEQFRKERDANRIVVAATAADFGPQTAEAAAVHAVRTKALGADVAPVTADETTSTST